LSAATDPDNNATYSGLWAMRAFFVVIATIAIMALAMLAILLLDHWASQPPKKTRDNLATRNGQDT